MEKSWSGQESPICQAASISAGPTVSIATAPSRRFPQNRSATPRSSRRLNNIHASTRMWSVVTSGSPDLRMALAPELLGSEESTAAYQIEVSTNMLMPGHCADFGGLRRRLQRRKPPRSLNVCLWQRPNPLNCRDRKWIQFQLPLWVEQDHAQQGDGHTRQERCRDLRPAGGQGDAIPVRAQSVHEPS